MTTSFAPKDYWLHQEPKKLIGHLEEAHTKWSLWTNSPFRQAWVRNIVAYYSAVVHPGAWDTSLIFEGVQGELVRMYTPQARTMVRNLVTIVTKQRLAMQAMAESQGQEVIDDTKLGNSVAEQLVTKERLDTKQETLVEHAIVTGLAFTRTVWNTDKGHPYIRDADGVMIYDGDVEVTTPTCLDVVYDVTIDNWDELPWVEVRVKKNRYDLIAQFPELERQILALPNVRQLRGPNSWFDRTFTDDDLVYVYELYARPGPALEQGRVVFYASEECVFFDGPNLYGTIPIEPMIPEPVYGTLLGYPQFTNLLACQEMFDNSISAIATNQSQFAVQTAAIPRGANVNVQELGGMRFISYTPQQVPGGGKPESVQLTQSSPETFKFADMLKVNMQEMSNINSTLRGNPPSGATSGVAIATLSANALEFTSSLTKSLHLCLEKTVMHGVNCYKKFATTPRIVMQRGKSGQETSRQFQGQDLQRITSVKMTMMNPLMQTIAGRLEIAEKLMGMPREQWPKYVAILEGEPLRKLYQTELSEEDLLCAEDESLSKGQEVPVLITDDHAAHIRGHASLLNDPMVRTNGQANQVILNHIMQHYELSKSAPPELTAMIRTGKMPEPGMVPPPGPGGPEPMLRPDLKGRVMGGMPPPPNEGGPEAPPPKGIASDVAALPTPKVANPGQDLLQRGPMAAGGR